MSEQYLVFGAGGHAKVVIDAILSHGHQDIQLFDDSLAKLNIVLLGYPVQGLRTDLIKASKKSPFAKVIIAIGRDTMRQVIYEDFYSQKICLGNIIHQSAVVSPSVDLGLGLMIMANAVVNPDAKLGHNIIVNTGAVIEHDCIISSHCHIAPHSTLCGEVSVGESSLIGAGAVVLPGIKIGKNCIVGAGSVVTQDVPDGASVMGVPAKMKEVRNV